MNVNTHATVSTPRLSMNDSPTLQGPLKKDSTHSKTLHNRI